MKPTILFLIIILLFIGIACSQISSKNEDKSYLNEITQTPTLKERVEECVTMRFRYLITQDYMATPNTRRIEVFLDQKAYSEENLKTLFTCLSDKNPEPKNSPNGYNLKVIVTTDWEQMHFPSDCPGQGASGGTAGTDRYDYHFANFTRRGENAAFIYNPILKTSKVKDVMLKGDEIFRNGQWQDKVK